MHSFWQLDTYLVTPNDLFNLLLRRSCSTTFNGLKVLSIVIFISSLSVLYQHMFFSLFYGNPWNRKKKNLGIGQNNEPPHLPFFHVVVNVIAIVPQKMACWPIEWVIHDVGRRSLGFSACLILGPKG